MLRFRLFLMLFVVGSCLRILQAQILPGEIPENAVEKMVKARERAKEAIYGRKKAAVMVQAQAGNLELEQAKAKALKQIEGLKNEADAAKDAVGDALNKAGDALNKAGDAVKQDTPAQKSATTKKADTKSAPVAKPEGPTPFLTRLADDSQIKIEITEPTISIVTKYGLLKIPTEEIKRLEVGLRYPAGLEAQLEKAIRDLGNEAFGVRDAAEKKILGFQELALPTIRTAMKDSDKEISSRAKRMLEQLQTALPEEKFSRKTTDLIVTDEFTARGKIELSELAIQSKIFGPAKLALHEIRNARSISREDNSEVTIDAALYGKQNRSAWMDSGFDVEQDNGLLVEASGQVDLLPQNPGQMLCGPTGFPNNEMSYRNPNGTTLRVSNGALLGKIGNNGAMFVIGGRYKVARPSDSGRLFLQVAPSSNGNDPSGSYKVKITQGE
jgi:hypothetical protein